VGTVAAAIRPCRSGIFAKSKFFWDLEPKAGRLPGRTCASRSASISFSHARQALCRRAATSGISSTRFIFFHQCPWKSRRARGPHALHGRACNSLREPPPAKGAFPRARNRISKRDVHAERRLSCPGDMECDRLHAAEGSGNATVPCPGGPRLSSHVPRRVQLTRPSLVPEVQGSRPVSRGGFSQRDRPLSRRSKALVPCPAEGSGNLVPEGQCDVSPVIYRRVFGIPKNRVPEGRLIASEPVK
jgi:hypothetical protein